MGWGGGGERELEDLGKDEKIIMDVLNWMEMKCFVNNSYKPKRIVGCR